jgi:uncharacterized protein YjbI with pentapeptide repeats
LDFVKSDSGWLTDVNTRFLLIFDGFDELLLQGREGGGLKELVQQLGDFQARTHHQCLVTGRPLALQGVARMLSQTRSLVRVRLEPMADPQRNEWLGNWAKLFGEGEANNFKAFLTACPSDIGEQLAREPLLLYLLGRLHRENHLNAQMFAGTKGMQAKVRVYDESVRWVLERQRQEMSEQIPGLAAEDLRQVLQEAALCVVQSGNETAKLTMLKSRFTDDANPVAELLKQAQSETERTEDKTLNNLLTAFYLKPGEGNKTGSVEFAHKSFREFLFAERLKSAFEDWVTLGEHGQLRLNDSNVDAQIYDILGHGLLTTEEFLYLQQMSFARRDFDAVRLFKRLHGFYLRWSNGKYIDKAPSENLPQRKMMQLRESDISIGLRQIDIYAGLNTLALLVGLHRVSAFKADNENPLIVFHPCGVPGDVHNVPDNRQFDANNLRQVLTYSQSLGIKLPNFIFIRANLSDANLVGINFSHNYLIKTNFYRARLWDANFSYANLNRANFKYAQLSGCRFHDANLTEADLSGADIISSDFTHANLSGADLSLVNLSPPDYEVDDFSYARFDSATLSNAICNSANLIESSFQSAVLTGIQFVRAILCGSDFRNADLSLSSCQDANFEGADLRSADFASADLSNANFSNANLSGANFSSADLSGANFSNANFSSADLSGANFSNANLSGANLDSIHCIKTDWDGARGLETARNLPNALMQKLDLGH